MMDKVKRSERMVAITRALTSQPGRLFTLREFVDWFGCAKSTLSEDITMVRNVLLYYGMGNVESVNGAAGGVRFLPFYSNEADRNYVLDLCQEVSKKERILPGGFLYTVDLFSDPRWLSRMGTIFAKKFYETSPDVVVTVESMGVPIALMVANALGKPLVTARRDHPLSEGSVVTLNYMSGSAKHVRTMSLPRRSLSNGQRALIIDDFMKGGGTARALSNIMGEFGVSVVGTGVMVATKEPEEKRVKEFCSILVLGDIDEDAGTVEVQPAEWLLHA